MTIFSKFFRIFKEIQSFAFTIDSIEKDDITGLIYIMVKVNGKGVPPFRRDPLDLNKEGRGSFSPEDFDDITNCLLENQKRLIEAKYKKYTLIKHQFSNQLEEPLLVYSDLEQKIHIKYAKEIYYDVEKIKKFSSEDSACIGNIVGCYETELEHNLRKEKNQIMLLNSIIYAHFLD